MAGTTELYDVYFGPVRGRPDVLVATFVGSLEQATECALKYLLTGTRRPQVATRVRYNIDTWQSFINQESCRIVKREAGQVYDQDDIPQCVLTCCVYPFLSTKEIKTQGDVDLVCEELSQMPITEHPCIL